MLATDGVSIVLTANGPVESVARLVMPPTLGKTCEDALLVEITDSTHNMRKVIPDIVFSSTTIT